jgi:UDP-3-O-[3-hydroxymyristoyl] N-acetylglucosamine deacetylase
VSARGGALRVGTVEHLFSAFAGLGVRDGVVVEVVGGELPLVDGGARAWCDAIASIGARRSAPRLRVTREARYEVGLSVYRLARGDEVDVRVRVELDDARLVPDAAWSGDANDFVERIAPARTFALARELDELLRRGLALRADPASVVVVTPDAILSSGRAFSADEPARHKLLDFLGDLYLYGGPFVGSVSAHRPGHAATHRALARALDEGVLERQSG